MNSIKWVVAGVAIAAGVAPAQESIPGKVEIAWNRNYDHPEIEAQLRSIAAAYPELVELRSLGKSLQGREMWLAVVNSPKTGPHNSKPAMWIDGNIHGNEVQAAEVVMYSLWYLTKAYGQNEKLTTLLDNYSFYFQPMVNPDGRAYWFEHANNSSSSRQNQRPKDDDRDGLLDEDPDDDLDGDGAITTMWKEVPDGDWTRDPFDPRIFRRVPAGKKGQWTRVGEEGLDNDNDGRINEDGPGGDDMNRNWPSGWQPEHVQGGAGLYPLSNLETRANAAWILEHPNIAAVQAYHNAGGMILRGPGAEQRENLYTFSDQQVYDEIATTGEKLLPYYRSMVTWRDLYTVHGGFINWTAEGLGAVSFTNELWNDAKYFQRDVENPDEERQWLWRDRVAFGQTFTDYKEFDHPRYGKVLIGGPNKWSSRVTPGFMIEEECHRNFAFTMYHADQMPLLSFGRTDIADLGNGLWSVTFEVRNEKVIPTRLVVAQQKQIGRNDILTVGAEGDAAGPRVIASGRVGGWFDRQMDVVRHEPARIQVAEGIPGRGARIFRLIVRGDAGATLGMKYEAEKARTIERQVELRASEPRP
jgi:hypothetical protein